MVPLEESGIEVDYQNVKGLKRIFIYSMYPPHSECCVSVGIADTESLWGKAERAEL